MGPWGVHYERTQTWWDWTSPWHDYLARCQLLLRQGLFVADLCFLQPEASPQGFHGHAVAGYGWDECSADVVMNRMTVRDGRLVLPDGMSYRLLVLPESATMTPALARQDQGAGRGRRNGRGTAADPVAQPERVSEMRRGNQGACRWTLGRLQRHDDQGAARGSRPDRLGDCAGEGSRRFRRAARLHEPGEPAVTSTAERATRTSTSSPIPCPAL